MKVPCAAADPCVISSVCLVPRCAARLLDQDASEFLRRASIIALEVST